SMASRTSSAFPTATPRGWSMEVRYATACLPASWATATQVRARARASSSRVRKAPSPTFTSRTKASAPPASFLLMMEAAISGTLSTVAVASRSAYSFLSAGARSTPALATATPTSRTTSKNSERLSSTRSPGMLSSLSRVPPVWPKALPESLATGAPAAATRGATTRVVLSPTPPLECLSTLMPGSELRSTWRPDRAMARVRAAVSRSLIPRKRMAIKSAALWASVKLPSVTPWIHCSISSVVSSWPVRFFRISSYGRTMLPPLGELAQEARSLIQRPDAEPLGEGRPQVGEGRPGPQGDAPIARGVREDGDILPGVVGGGRGGVTPVIGGDDEAVLRPQGLQDPGQEAVHRLQPRRVRLNVVPMAPQRVDGDAVGEDQARLGSGPEQLQGGLQHLLVVGRGHLVGDAPAGEDVGDLPHRVDSQAGLLEPVEEGRTGRGEAEVPPVGGAPVDLPDPVGPLFGEGPQERPGDHPADGVLALEDFPRDLAHAVELLEGDHLFVGRDLEDAVRGGVDDGRARPDMLVPQLLDDDRPRGGPVPQDLPADGRLKPLDHLGREPVRVGGHGPVQGAAHQL